MRRLARYLSLWLLVGLFGGAAAAADLPDRSLGSTRLGLPFAIADFDGDSRPDVARVESGRSDFTNTEYWIELRLSAANWESIRLVAPAGGLELSARDVNGDAFVDLVVSTAWSNRPVAIYLNDGHGFFTHADPAAFPQAFSDSEAAWTFSVGLAADGLVVASSQDTASGPEEREYSYAWAPAGLLACTELVYRLGAPLFLHAGRAPPSKIFNL
jgi:hypothetical protein